MAPVYGQPSTQSSLQTPGAIEGHSTLAPPVDSPLEITLAMPDSTNSPHSSATSGKAASYSPEISIAALNAGNTSSKDSKPWRTSKGKTSFRFFTVNHPKKLKDKQQMTSVRKHVMFNFLDKERQNPESTDARVTGSASASKKRKRLVDVHMPGRSSTSGTSSNPMAPNHIFGPRQTSVSSVRSTDSSNGSSKGHQDQPPTSDQETPAAKRSQTTKSRPVIFYDDIAPLIKGVSGGFNSSRYLQTSIKDVPNPTSSIGSNLNPFDTWPALSSGNIEELKWCCSRKFSSQGISTHWVPTLLLAKHAFLSTICISSSHEDIMKRGMQQPHERLPYGSNERMQARGEVISLINQAMEDDQSRTADTTIVAVLQLLNSEIMGCNDQVLKIHQQGLHELVRQRGGLDHLGVEGQLASILTITMYLISALRETEPHSDFVKYAAQGRTKPPQNNDYQPIPESPVYCRLSGYHTIHKAVTPSSPVYRLLESLRLLTNSFVRGTGSNFVSPLTPIRTNTSWEQCHHSVHLLRDEIFSLEPAEQRPQSFTSNNEKHMYEALRLVAMLYSHALANEMPFSKAAKQLAHRYNTTFPHKTPQSWHILIKFHIQRTDLSDCWSHLAGVLFWLTLVAGACANPDSISVQTSTRDRWDENEEARKWLTAVAVRCSIVMGFEYGGAILETLKRVVGIEQALEKAEADREKELGGAKVLRSSTVKSATVNFSNVRQHSARPRAFGPAEMPFVQRTFQDFAQDFLSDTL